MSELLLDRAGRRRSPATMPGFHAGQTPRNKRLRYRADPPKVEEIIAVMRAAGDGAHGRRRRAELRRTAASAGVRRRFAPHQLRHTHAVEMAREGVPLIVIQRQLGHGNLGITSVYLQGIDSGEIIETVHARPR
jgi:site-specific recombinase XerD